MAVFTPGPWKIDPHGEGPSRYVIDATGDDIARVRGGEPETEGNAQLIVAGPDMYALLLDMLNGHGFVYSGHRERAAAILARIEQVKRVSEPWPADVEHALLDRMQKNKGGQS